VDLHLQRFKDLEEFMFIEKQVRNVHQIWLERTATVESESFG
jgi:hypothetical protein